VSGFGLRTDRWRYIEWSDGNAELYDHAADPEEWHNVAGDAANAKLLAELKGKLSAQR
jgi:arylsulfatase A-like enzyme